MAVTDPMLGRVISGCRLERLLGRGGMGAVYAAAREEDDHRVVLKLLKPVVGGGAELRSRFQREGEALQKIPPHPNVVRVEGVFADHDPPHLILELVEGSSLQQLVRDGPLEPREAVRLAQHMALGLAVIHRHGLVHRDVKPENALLTPGGQVKLVDLGIAKDLFRTALTLPGQVVGTPYYMAPEQWGDQAVDARCDIWALGATLYHLLTGEPPYVGDDANQTAELIVEGDLELPGEQVDLPRELDLVVAQMLATDRRFRYARMDEVAEDLGRILVGKPSRVPCLMGGELRFPLVPGRRFAVGRRPTSAVSLTDRSVSKRHAEIRREASGFVLRDLGSTHGTWIGPRRETRAVTLRHGDEVRFGKVTLQFLDPCTAESATPYLAEDLRRREVPEAVLRVLARLPDRRTTLALIERLVPDPQAATWAWRTLSSLLGEDIARRACQLRDELEARRRTTCLQLLGAATGQGFEDPGAWLAWWEEVRAEHTEQVCAPSPQRVYRLRVLEGEPGPADLLLNEGDVFLIGRDEKCHLSLTQGQVSRLHARLLRMHQRLVIRDEQSRFGTLLNGERVAYAFLSPGDRLQLGGVKLVLEVADPAADEQAPLAALGLYRIDTLAFDALQEAKHPCVVTATVMALHEPHRQEWVPRIATELFPDSPERASVLTTRLLAGFTRRAARARQLLTELLGQDEGDHPGRWSQLLAERRSHLGPQVVAPLGLLI